MFPTVGFTTLPASEKLEEENWPWYTPQSFYPVRIGDVLHSKYQALYKLGYGTTATIWLCRDLQSVPLFYLLKQAKGFQSQ
jgi:serine/threonine-protein kinase SRPK3